jgi:SAM-dependent methyltransferase
MCSRDTLKWLGKILQKEEVIGKRIIDIGAYDVNGSMKAVVAPWQPSEYIGIDMRSGPGVDIVCLAENLVSNFGKESFDIVLSSSTFEHIKNWKGAISNVKQICKPNGLILLIIPSRWPYHAFPKDYWRFDSKDIKCIFSDCEILDIEEDISPLSLIYAKIRKPSDFIEKNISNYELWSVITGSRVIQIKNRDYFSSNFFSVFWSDVIKPKIKYCSNFVKIGVKIRIAEPLITYYRNNSDNN